MLASRGRFAAHALAFAAAVVGLACASGCGAPLPPPNGFWFPEEGRIVDLTRREEDANARVTTLVTGLADGSAGGTIDKFESGRCVAPLVVLDVRERATRTPELVFTTEDLADLERLRGEIPPGALVVLATGGGQRERGERGAPDRTRHAGLSSGVIELLVRQRGIVGFGTDAPALDSSAAPTPEATRATVSLGAFVLTNLARLDQLPDGRAIALLAPPPQRVPQAPARVLALAVRTVGRVSR